MPLINCEISLIPIWSLTCVISEGNRGTTFAITDAKRHVPVVTLSTILTIVTLSTIPNSYHSISKYRREQTCI